MNLDKLVTLFDHIKEEWKKDSQIDFDIKESGYTENLGKLSLDTPFQHNKYLNHHSDLSLKKISLEFEIRKLIKDKREYYGGEADAKVYAEKPFGSNIKTSEKMRVYLDSDEDILNLESKVRFIEIILNYLDSVMKMINQRNYLIKNAIEWEKFTNGL
jgi:hypothetical protein